MQHVAANILVVGFLVFVAHAFTGIFSRTRLPDVLLLTIIGIILGPVTHIASPENFGSVGPVFASVTLVLLLFEAGLTLDLDVLQKSIRSTLTLTVTNFFATMIAVGIAAYYFTGLSPRLTFMLGAIIGSTSPAVIVPLTRGLNMEPGCKTVLLLESALSDVLSIVFAIGLADSYRFGKVHLTQMAGQIISTLLMAAIAGAGFAFLWSLLLKRVRGLENSMFTTPAFVFVLFGVVELLGYSGYVATVVFGAVLGNIESFHRMPGMRRLVPAAAITLNENERIFIAEATFLLKTFFFIYLGVSIKFSELRLVYFAIGITALIFLLRPIAAWLGLPRSTKPQDAALVSIMSPKGLAAVVLASIPMQQNLPGGEMLRDMTYSIVLISIVFTCVLSFLVERTMVKRVYLVPFRHWGTRARPAHPVALPE